MRIGKVGIEEKQIICPQCGSELFYTFMDIKHRKLPLLIEIPYVNYIICPVCKKKIILSKKS